LDWNAGLRRRVPCHFGFQNCKAQGQRGETDGQSRLEAFSDGVIAIIITIMVLELKVPHGDGWAMLLPLAPVMLSYVLSFTYAGIYWNKLQYGCYPLTSSQTSKMILGTIHLFNEKPTLLNYATSACRNHFCGLTCRMLVRNCA
jgi:hypothetical protein